MNKLMIIGNLTRDVELRTVGADIPVATFTIAVNKRVKPGEHPEADYFRCTVWRQLAENCAKYLSKGRKVAVVGSVQVNTYTAKDGTTKANLEVNADEVEFLSPRDEVNQATEDRRAGFVPLDVDDEELSF